MGYQFDLPPPTFRPDKAFGPWFVGMVVEVLLTGAAVSMAIDYWRMYALEDRKIIKSLVLSSIALCIAKSMQACAMLWHKLIDGFASYMMAKTSSPWYARIDPAFAISIILIAQTFFLLRLNSLLKNVWRYALIPICLAMVCSFAGHVAITVQMFRMTGKHESWSYVVICSCFCFILSKSKTGMARTDSLVSRLVLLAWTTALLPAVCDLCKLTTYLVFGTKSSAFIAFSLSLPKLYTVAMLVTLNLRAALRTEEKFHISTDYQLSYVGTAATPGSGRGSGRGAQVQLTATDIRFRRPNDTVDYDSEDVDANHSSSSKSAYGSRDRSYHDHLDVSHTRDAKRPPDDAV
ncbi:hypothetical protein BKA62DRAFT_834424 [Auriculariales sp. MPI-PUGE-AT-0066]|nr:hypothetical protein BKA62DRAFT_834424 [Auriculariales sp. MPI-PUGE-AT-0066]